MVFKLSEGYTRFPRRVRRNFDNMPRNAFFFGGAKHVSNNDFAYWLIFVSPRNHLQAIIIASRQEEKVSVSWRKII